MKYIKKVFPLLAVALMLVITGCASKLPNQSFNASANTNIKKICIVKPPAPDKFEVFYHNHPGMNFGLIGGLAAAAEFSSKSSSYNKAIGKEKFDVTAYFIQSLKKEFQNTSYEIEILPSAPRKDMEYCKVFEKSDSDAYLDCYIPTIGYVAGSSSSLYKPTVKTFARLVSNGSNDVLYEKMLVSGESTYVPEDADYLEYDVSHTYDTFSNLESNATQSVKGLKNALDSVAKRIVLSLGNQK